jgi:hypothetical protein
MISGDTNGKIDTCCGYGADGKKTNFDCIQIPSASKAADSAILAANGICGQKGLVTAAGAALATVCCKLKLDH